MHVAFMYVHELEALNREGAIIDTLKPILQNIKPGESMVAFARDEKHRFALATLYQAYTTFKANAHQPILHFEETDNLIDGRWKG